MQERRSPLSAAMIVQLRTSDSLRRRQLALRLYAPAALGVGGGAVAVGAGPLAGVAALVALLLPAAVVLVAAWLVHERAGLYVTTGGIEVVSAWGLGRQVVALRDPVRAILAIRHERVGRVVTVSRSGGSPVTRRRLVPGMLSFDPCGPERRFFRAPNDLLIRYPGDGKNRQWQPSGVQWEAGRDDEFLAALADFIDDLRRRP